MAFAHSEPTFSFHFHSIPFSFLVSWEVLLMTSPPKAPFYYIKCISKCNFLEEVKISLLTPWHTFAFDLEKVNLELFIKNINVLKVHVIKITRTADTRAHVCFGMENTECVNRK